MVVFLKPYLHVAESSCCDLSHIKKLSMQEALIWSRNRLDRCVHQSEAFDLYVRDCGEV